MGELHYLHREKTPWERAESYAPWFQDEEMRRHSAERDAELLSTSGFRLTLGERLVATFRANGETLSFYFAMCAITFAVGVIVFAYVERGL